MMSLLERAERFVHIVNEVFLWTANVLLAVLTVLVFQDVILRYFVGGPTLWGLDITRFLLAYIFFLALAPTMERRGHIGVDILETFVSKENLRRLNIMSLGAVVFFSSLFLFYVTKTTIDAFERGYLIMAVLHVEARWIYAIGPIGVAQFLLTAIVMLVRSLVSAPSEIAHTEYQA